jgi:hypothetical protein
MDKIDITSKSSELMLGEIVYNTDNGANFCQVRRSSPDGREIPCVTSGTQK